ncbi:MAG: nitronate monooxygenase [Pseudomonadota bacterium]|nr:nitronate monooxygenase [Pseudomonadota bacterium]
MFNFSKLKLPIIQAPMAGGMNTPELASAVANAGGVGSFGFAYSTPQQITEDLIATKALTNGPINANVFVFKPTHLPARKIQSAAIEALENLPIEGEYSLSIPKEPFHPNLKTQLDPIWIQRPAILTFHFGIPPQTVIEKAHSLGIVIGITATSIDEALAIEKAGGNFIVAQGIEAGGHRGVFNPEDQDDDLSLEELIAGIVKASHLPLVAAGAIMSGADINRVLKLGAAAAQLGTAFLCCDETGISRSQKQFLLEAKNRKTTFTTSFSGRRAQGINNKFMQLMEGRPTLPFPMQNTLTGPIRKLAAKNNDWEYQSLWAGRAYQHVRMMTATQLMYELESEIKVAQK